MPADPTVLWRVIESGGLIGLLFVGCLLFVWLYISERNARTEDIKNYAQQFLSFSQTNDKVASALDSLSTRISELERRIEWSKRD